MVDDADLEEKLMQVAFSDPRETSPEIFAKLGRTLRDGEILFREGETSTELIIIVSGKCKITKMVSGQEKTLAILGAEEILGEMSHFDDAPRSATARAVGTLNVLSFSRENFGMIFELHHKWTLKLIQALSNRCHQTFQRLIAAHDELPPVAAVRPAAQPAAKPAAKAQPPAPAAAKPQPAARPAQPPPPRPPPAPPVAAIEPVPPGLDGPKVEKFLSDLRQALSRGATLEALRAKALSKLSADPVQRRKVEDLLDYAGRRLKTEGLA